MSTKIIRAIPVLSSSDVPRDLLWWKEKVGFQIQPTSADEAPVMYGIIHRAGIVLHLQWHSDTSSDPVNLSSIRIEVQQIRPLFDELVDRGLVQEQDFRSETAWGTNEFGFYDLNNNAIHIYEDAE